MQGKKRIMWMYFPFSFLRVISDSGKVNEKFKKKSLVISKDNKVISSLVVKNYKIRRVNYSSLRVVLTVL